MIPEYIRFYGGRPIEILDEFAVTFFALLNRMYSIQATEQLDAIYAVNVGTSGKDSEKYIDGLLKQQKGISGIVEEVKVLNNVR